jgi:hypothetical protein
MCVGPKHAQARVDRTLPRLRIAIGGIDPVSAGRERLFLGRQIARDRWFVSRAPAPLPSADSAKLRTDARRIAYVSKVRASATDPIALAVSCAAGEVPFRTVPNVDPYRG